MLHGGASRRSRLQVSCAVLHQAYFFQSRARRCLVACECDVLQGIKPRQEAVFLKQVGKNAPESPRPYRSAVFQARIRYAGKVVLPTPDAPISAVTPAKGKGLRKVRKDRFFTVTNGDIPKGHIHTAPSFAGISGYFPHEKHDQPLKRHTQQDNDQCPCKQVRCFQIYLGVVELRADGIARGADHLGGNARLPRKPIAVVKAVSKDGRALGKYTYRRILCLVSPYTRAISKSCGRFRRSPLRDLPK